MKWLSRILTVIVTMSMACGALIFNHKLLRAMIVTHACTNRIAFVDADVTFLRKDAVETLINQYQL